VTVEKDADYEGKKPPKGVIHWVAQPKPGQDPEPMEVRLYSMLFKSPEPDSLDDFLEDLDPDSLEIIKGAYGTSPLYNAKVRTSSPSVESTSKAVTTFERTRNLLRARSVAPCQIYPACSNCCC
jgi:hypothetical protein